MLFLVVGATGMTGRHVVRLLLEKNCSVRVIVRREGVLDNHENLEVVKANLLDLCDSDLDTYTRDCDGVISCLGHVMSFSGIWGQPRDLVTKAIKRLCESFQRVKVGENDTNTNADRTSNVRKIILMNTVGVTVNDEKRSVFDNCLLCCIRSVLPPHRDNENAAAYLKSLSTDLEENEPKSVRLEWSVVRPDTLTDNDKVTPYEVIPSPVTTIANGNDTHRINVADFMVGQAVNEQSQWEEWRYRFPVIMNRKGDQADEKKEDNQNAWE